MGSSSIAVGIASSIASGLLVQIFWPALIVAYRKKIMFFKQIIQ